MRCRSRPPEITIIGSVNDERFLQVNGPSSAGGLLGIRRPAGRAAPAPATRCSPGVRSLRAHRAGGALRDPLRRARLGPFDDLRARRPALRPAGPGGRCCLIDALGLDRAHFAGLSQGGAVGQLLAIDHGESLATLTLLATTPGDPSREARPAGNGRPAGLGLRARGVRARWADRESAIDHLVETERPFAGSGDSTRRRNGSTPAGCSTAALTSGRP